MAETNQQRKIGTIFQERRDHVEGRSSWIDGAVGHGRTQEGTFLQIWMQFGTPSGIFFDDQDQIYVADSESDLVNNPGWEQGIRIGDARTGWVKYFILNQGGNPNSQTGSGPEFVTVDCHGSVFGGEPCPRVLRKYVKVIR